MIVEAVFVLVLLAGLFPQSPLGQMFRTALFGDPDRLDAKLRIPKFAQALLVAFVVMSMAPYMPVEMALFFMGDTATYLEVTMALMMLGVTGRTFRLIKASVSAGIRLMVRAAVSVRMLQRRVSRQRRITRMRSPPKPGDDHRPGWAFAWA